MLQQPKFDLIPTPFKGVGEVYKNLIRSAKCWSILVDEDVAGLKTDSILYKVEATDNLSVSFS